MSGIASRPGDSRASHSDIVESSLRGGRIEAVVNGLWQKIVRFIQVLPHATTLTFTHAVDACDVGADVDIQSHVQSASQHYQKDIRDLQHKITKLQMALDTAAGVKQVETLGVVVEEQRQRIDSLILGTASIRSYPILLKHPAPIDHFLLLQLEGSTTIGPIAEEMASIQLQLSELRSYLQLPQAKPLQSQLDEAGELIEGWWLLSVPHLIIFD